MLIAVSSFNHFWQGETWRFLPGDVVPSDMAEEIGNKAVFREANPEEAGAPAVIEHELEEEETFDEPKIEYGSYNMKELRAMLRERKIEPSSQTKAGLIEALEAFDAAG